MPDYFEIDFLGVETAKSGDAITLRYSINGVSATHVVDGGYVDTGTQVIDHLKTYYGTTTIDHVVLTHPDRDHANGLRAVLEQCTVRNLWMNRPWMYSEELLPRFKNYNSPKALEKRLRAAYDATATLEEIALRRGIPISAAFQGQAIGAFTVLAPTKNRYLDLIVESEKTPEAETSNDPINEIFESLLKAYKAATVFIKSMWGEESFPVEPTSRENEMSIVQSAQLNGQKILLTGDAGREALSEAIGHAPTAGLALPGINYFQVPHHGGRHNVSTDVLDALLGNRLAAPPEKPSWHAVCSSAKADEDHPRKSVIRAMLHRGGHFSATEGRCIRVGVGIERPGWNPIPQTPYPDEQEK